MTTKSLEQAIGIMVESTKEEQRFDSRLAAQRRTSQVALVVGADLTGGQHQQGRLAQTQKKPKAVDRHTAQSSHIAKAVTLCNTSLGKRVDLEHARKAARQMIYIPSRLVWPRLGRDTDLPRISGPASLQTKIGRQHRKGEWCTARVEKQSTVSSHLGD